MKSTVKRLFACCAAVFTACSVLAASTLANQAWVKAYIEECIKNGKIGTAWSNDYTPAASIAEVTSGTVTVTNGVTGCLVANICTNEAYLVTDSSVTNIADGTYFVWDSVNQAWYNKSCAALPVFYEKEVPYNVTNAVGGVSVSYYWYYYNTDKGFSSILKDGVYWMMVSGDRNKCFRLNKTTVSDSVKASLIPGVVAYSTWDIFGEMVTLYTEACSRDRHDGDSGGGTGFSYRMTIRKADGSTYSVDIDLSGYFSQPTAMKQCDGYTEDGKACILQVPDYSKWYSLDNWIANSGFPIKTPYTNVDGVQITISREAVAGCWNSAYVDKLIEQSKANHKHEGKEDEEDEEEEHDHVRGHNCCCSYVFKDGHTCGEQMAHLGPEDGAACYRACSNEDCDLYNQVTHGGVVPFTSGAVEKGHWCSCYGSTQGAWPLPGYIYGAHNKVEQGREKYASGYNVTYYCAVCDYTWVEFEAGDHVHEWYLVDGNEVCLAEKYDEDGNDMGTCNATRGHAFESNVGNCGKNCQNELFGGSTCGYSSHGGYWHRVQEGGSDYHACDCGEMTGGHGGEVTSERYVDEDGWVHIRKTQQCPDPDSGCGALIESDDKTGEREKQPGEHSCTYAGDDIDECTRGTDCCCDQHPIHQFEHLWSTQNGCKFCRNESCKYHEGSASEGDHNYSRGYAQSLDGASYTCETLPPELPELKGHTCGCGKGKAHGHHFSAPVKIDSEWEQEVCDADPSDACGFVYKHKITSDCEHKDDLELSTWADCVCQKCGTNRVHNCATVIPQEGTCPIAQCNNRNGTSSLCGAKAGLMCSYTEATALKPSLHCGWSSLDEYKHACGCGKVTEYHDPVAGAVTNDQGKVATCWIITQCSKCGLPLKKYHNISPAKMCNGVIYDFSTGTAPVRCKVCGMIFDEDADGNYSQEGRAATDDDHYFPPKSCTCNCGERTKHAYPDPADFCGCFCGTNSAPHVQAPDSCYCIGAGAKGSHEPVLVEHLTPYSQEVAPIGSNTCDTCGTVLYKYEEILRCERCDEIVSDREYEDSHTCSGGANVTPCTFSFSWEPYDMNSGTNTEDQYTRDVHVEGGTIEGVGMSAGNRWMYGSSITFGGGTATVSETGTYYLYTCIDDSGTVNVGPLSGSGGGHWTKWGSTGPATYVAGVGYSVSGNASSGESICGAAFALVKEGEAGPDGSIAGESK